MAAEAKYLESRDLVKSESLMLYVDGKLVAYTTKHSFSLQTDKQDISSKMSGDWDESLAGKLSWSVEAECLVTKTKGHLSKDLLLQMLAERKPFKMEIAEVTRAIAATGEKTITKGAVKMQGMCVLTDYKEDSAKGEYTSASVSLTGTGPLFDGANKELGSAEARAALGVG